MNNDVQAAEPKTLVAAKQVVVAGAGNIGSHLLPLLARGMSNQTLTVIDPDGYEMANLPGQEMLPSDVGRNKAEVQVGRIRGIRPDLQAVAIAQRIEHVPLGLLADSIIVCATDSRRSRQSINRMAIRLGLAWIDAAVDGPSWQFRINVYDPARTGCLECGWSDDDYAAVEQRYLCRGRNNSPATNSPASLGASAAGLAALEVDRLLSGQTVDDARQLFCDVRHWTQFKTALPRNPDCRCDHTEWTIDDSHDVNWQWTVGQLLDAVSGPLSSPRIRLEGQTFANRLVCAVCTAVEDRPLLVRATERDQAPRCRACAAPLTARGFDQSDQLHLDKIDGRLQLADIGLLPDDVICLTSDNGAAQQPRYFRLQGERR